ncbi:hypothetical protein FD20_GL002500 [Liquorilactobacillus uvarum DSM 19971]|uniref:Uncharacterized protein n=1 Tax=Liquorilactobacillus uvarum DSM 19971 TaxID=1423812 RepID=A0A0R1PJP8_9LACO|nr:hypothetical protein FD20_GL002500 [Liquorilactobacillus uvarum DSM 19971]
MKKRKNKANIDLDYETYLNYIRRYFKDKNNAAIIRKLKKDKLVVVDGSDEEETISNVYDSVIFEEVCENKKYLLCFGIWYEVSKTFYEKIRSRIRKIKKAIFSYHHVR